MQSVWQIAAGRYALEVNDSAVKVLGDQTLRTIARELVETVRRNTSIDWTCGSTATRLISRKRPR